MFIVELCVEPQEGQIKLFFAECSHPSWWASLVKK